VTTIQVLLNQLPHSQIEVPSEGTSWSFLSLLSDDLPPQAEWIRVRFSSEKNHHTISKAATALGQSMTVELSSKDERIRFDFFDLLGVEGARTRAAKSHRALLDPVSIEVVTVEPTPEEVWPRLRIEAAGRGQGQLVEKSVANIPQTKNPFKPKHDGGWTVREVVALYTDEFSAVELESKSKTVKLSRAQVDGSATILLRATKKGFWVLKRWEAGNTKEPDETVRYITELRIIR
jgi:hypothetical protein